MLVSERVDGTEHERSHQSTEEGAPQRFQWKIVTDLQSYQQYHYSKTILTTILTSNFTYILIKTVSIKFKKTYFIYNYIKTC